MSFYRSFIVFFHLLGARRHNGQKGNNESL
jgi:hypothetical protein